MFVTLGSALLVTLSLGLLVLACSFVYEIIAVVKRIGYIFDKEKRSLFTWKTAVWFPVRVYFIFVVPQIFFVIFKGLTIS